MRKVSSRITAIAACLAMLSTAAAVPQFAQNVDFGKIFASSDANAASVASLTDDTKSPERTNVFTGYVTDYINSGLKKITFYVTAQEDVNFTYGFGIDIKADPWWLEYDASGKFIDTKGGTIETDSPEVALKAGVSTPITIDLSSIASQLKYDAKGTKYAAHFEFRNYYSGGKNITLDQVKANDSSTPSTPSTTGPKTTTGSDPSSSEQGDTLKSEALPKDLTDDTATIVKTVTYKNKKSPINYKNNTYIGVSSDYKNAKTLTFYLESKEPLYSFTYGFGCGRSKDNDYWGELGADGKTYSASGAGVSVDAQGKTSFKIKITLPDDYSTGEGGADYDPDHFEFRNYFSEGNAVTLTKIVANDTSKDDVLEPIKANSDGLGFDKTIVDGQTIKKNADGTLTIKTKLTRKIDNPIWSEASLGTIAAGTDSDGKAVSGTPVTLTPGHDESEYKTKDEKGNITGSSWKIGDPINSFKVDYSAFGLDDIKNSGIEIDSLAVTLKTDGDATATRFMYGGGIGVMQGTKGDTESVKKAAGLEVEGDGYWYNDIGQNKMQEWTDAVKKYKAANPDKEVIDPNTGFNITDFDPDTEGMQGSSYFTVNWQVPESIRSDENPIGGMSFQYWYGQKETDVESPTAEDLDLGPATVQAAYITYTQTKTVPYTGELTYSKAINLESGDEKELSLKDDFGAKWNYDIYGAKVNITTPKDSQLVLDYGVANKVDPDKFYSADYLTTKGSNYVIPVSDGKAHDYAFLFPTSIANYDVTSKRVTNNVDPNGSFKFADWYSALLKDSSAAGAKINSITLYYKDALDVEEKEITMKVGDTYQIVPTSTDGVTYKSDNERRITVSDSGLITAVSAGVGYVTVARGEETVQIKVTVTADTTTTAVTTTTTKSTTTTKTTTTTAKPTTAAPTEPPTVTIPWDGYTLYADVNVDDQVTIADLVLIERYLSGTGSVTPIGIANSDCYQYGNEKHVINANDAEIIAKREVFSIVQDQLPITVDKATLK